jgi:transcriptional regulator with XRE-family HTH domain
MPNTGEAMELPVGDADAEAAALDREIGARLRYARKARGMTQSALGAVLGVSFQQVQKYEQGRNRISASSLILFSRVLSVSPMELLGLAGRPSGSEAWFLMAVEGVDGLLEAYREMPSRRRKLLREFAQGLAQNESEEAEIP